MRRGTLAGWAATGVAAALVVGVSVVWPGLDAQETPTVDAAVWALQTGDGRRYARVNAAVGELDTVRGISNPDQVVHTGDAAYLFSDSYTHVTRIDEAHPVDLDETALQASTTTPVGTIEAATAGDVVAYRTDSGAIYAGLLSEGTTTKLDPFPSDDRDAREYTADAIAVDERGMLFAYSRADGAVLRFDVRHGEVRARDPIEPDGLGAPAITAVGDAWVLVDTEDGDVWRRGADAAEDAPTTGRVVVGAPVASGDAVFLADETALVRVPADGSEIEKVFGDEDGRVIGTPAQPIVHDGEVFAAWLPQGQGDGVLWRSGSTFVPLPYGGEELPDERRPVFVANESAVILNETLSGWAWSVPGGELIPSSQDWSLDDRTEPDAEPSDEQLQVVIDPKPPIAEADAFGVRAGTLVSLPVLLNDHDPNEDVLTIDPESVTGLDPGFGAVSITDDGQRFAVRVEPGATGSAQFSYAVTDGTSVDGLRSEPATVTLTVATADADSAPEWCGVQRCLAEWPRPEVARGGTVTVPVLNGWVDPEGDPLLLLSAVNMTGVGSVAATPAGDVVYQHSDDGDGGEQLVELVVTVADTHGRTAEKPLVVTVSPQPRLAVQSFAVTDVATSGVTVDVAGHVTGTAGALSLKSVRVLDDAAATATLVGGSTAFDFTAKEPGTFRVDFTVTDGVTDATGTVRITILPPDAPAQLATAPVVAFVQPQQDATLEVFAAVSNPTRRVLLLSDVIARADAGASLSVDAVGQNHLRVSGATADGGPGRLGTVSYVVSDGTEDAGSRVEGEATVYLLPPAPELAPIAVDDAVVVRAGAQIDIPALANDIAPAGGVPLLDPASVESSTPDALAFASGDVIRYLAPDVPGQYRIQYSVSTPGAPALADDATVRVDVLDGDANRAPTAETLEGRVLSGQSVLVEFDGYGMDPDGDVVSLDRIVEQPEQGAATISADGRSIVYTSVAGHAGQVSFPYRVVDAFGQTAEGTVRIGVLGSDANPSPVTYTDYVQVQAGAGNTIRVSPLSNDVDPTMGSLRITDVRPDAPEILVDGSANPEYPRLRDRIRSTDDGTVVIAAGEVPTTMSFHYDVESSSGNTGRGLIVVRVVRESVPDYPIVSDTILTVETREDFVRGVDVLTGKTTWSGGDPADLEVALWGEPEDVTVQGTRLRGELPATMRLIPFAVTGEGSAGTVTTYAFLRVPGDDDLAVALRAGVTPPEVKELESTTFDMARLVARPRGSAVEVAADVRASGARAEASCSVESGTVVRYDAGAGAPWADSCRVPVRIAGAGAAWTYLSVPIVVQAREPQPELRTASITVGPGESATYDLRSMTTWQLREDWSGIRYRIDYGGTAFAVAQQGALLTVTGADRAVPGTEEAVVVEVTSHAKVVPGRLILRVGAAPSTMPQGGSVVGQCSQASGSSCTIGVIGGAGEINPLPRTPLEVVDVRPVGACVGVTFAVASPREVTATWAADAPGATCTATFSVRDAQGRVTSAQRDGRLLLDLLGYPRPPAGLVQTGYADGAVTLRVDPGGARQAYPSLIGFVVRSGGAEVARCGADGVCPSIAAPNGELRTYEARAVNGVGESAAAVRTTAWAYDPPPAPESVTARPVVTSGEGGVVALVIDGVDPRETGSLEITSPTGEVARIPVRPNQTRVEVPAYRVGANTATIVTVTPYSRFDPPPGLGATPSGASVTTQAHGIGAPREPRLTLSSSSNGDGTVTITAQGSALPGGDGALVRYGIVPEGDRCTPREGGQDATFSGYQDGREYRFTLCADSWFDGDSFGTVSVTESVRARQSGRAPRDWTFVVAPDPSVTSSRAEWTIRDQPTSSDRIPFLNRVEFQGWPGSTVFGQDPQIRVRYVHEVWGDDTPWATVAPRAGSAPYQVQASWRVTSCVGGGTLATAGESSSAPGGGQAAVSFGSGGLAYYDAEGALLPHPADSWTVPAGAVRVEGISVTVDWSAQGWGLAPATATFGATCQPGDAPAPPVSP